MTPRSTTPTVAIVSSGLGHVARGIETWAADTADVLHALGHRVTLLKGSGTASRPYERVVRCARRGGPANRLLNRLLPGPFWHVGLGSSYDIEQTSFAPHLIPRLARATDVVHTQDPLVALILQRARRLGLIRAPVILGHGTEEPLEWLQKIEFVQHLAPFHLEEARRAGCHRPGWTAIGNFVDTDRFRPGPAKELRSVYGLRPDSLVVLCVAAVKRHHKRADYLVREVARLKERSDAPVELLVVGARTGQTDEVMALADELLGEAAHFLLDQPRARMPEIYRLGDVFALASLKEMMPIALLEAMATGLPCVVSTHPVVGWMAGSGGEPVEMEKPGALARALTKYSDPGYRREKGAAARREAVERFSKEAIVRKYLAMYRRVIALSNGRATP